MVEGFLYKGHRYNEIFFDKSADYVGLTDGEDDINCCRADDVLVMGTALTAREFLLGMTLKELSDCHEYVDDNEVNWSYSV